MTAGSEMREEPASAEIERLRRRVDRAERARAEAERITESTTRELYARQQELKLLVDVVGAANHSAQRDRARRRRGAL